MGTSRSALYLDFDNVFSGLVRLDPRLAMRFAEEPQLWLSRLAPEGDGEPPRRWLVLRCYINPAGSVQHPLNDGSKVYFSRFRSFFTAAGFEVIDCPRLSHTKNGADIRLVIDAIDALRADVHYDEFVVASGDSDMTPLLVRLRAADRRVILLSPSDATVGLAAVADRMLGGEEFLELLDIDAEAVGESTNEPTGGPADPSVQGPGAEDPVVASEAHKRFGLMVTERYNIANGPLNLATLANDVVTEIGLIARTTRWFGYGSFGKAIQALNLPDVQLSQHHVWDRTRHSTPSLADAGLGALDAVDAVAAVTRALKLPSLPTPSWTAIYESLAAFVADHEFNLTEATRWSRDELVASNIRVNRQAVSFVAHGAAFGGCPLFRQPPPAPGEIANAFVANVLNRAAAAEVELSPDDSRLVSAWLGVD